VAVKPPNLASVKQEYDALYTALFRCIMCHEGNTSKARILKHQMEQLINWLPFSPKQRDEIAWEWGRDVGTPLWSEAINTPDYPFLELQQQLPCP
jgi:hypothetical protein